MLVGPDAAWLEAMCVPGVEARLLPKRHRRPAEHGCGGNTSKSTKSLRRTSRPGSSNRRMMKGASLSYTPMRAAMNLPTGVGAHDVSICRGCADQSVGPYMRVDSSVYKLAVAA